MGRKARNLEAANHARDFLKLSQGFDSHDELYFRSTYYDHVDMFVTSSMFETPREQLSGRALGSMRHIWAHCSKLEAR